MALVQQTDPLTETVTDAEAKLFAKIDTTADDELVTSLLLAATSCIETEMARSFVSTDWKLTLDCFPEERTFQTNQRFIQICRTPLISVDSILYFDTEGVQQTLASSEFIVDTESEPARIVEAPDVSWPSTQNRINGVEVNFTAGFGVDATFVPEKIKTIVKMMFEYWYEHREIALDKQWKILPKHIQFMIDLEKIFVFA